MNAHIIAGLLFWWLTETETEAKNMVISSREKSFLSLSFHTLQLKLSTS